MYTYNLQYKGITITEDIKLAEIIRFTIELLESENITKITIKEIIYNVSYNLSFGSNIRIDKNFYIKSVNKTI